jgi:hypothetical protein
MAMSVVAVRTVRSVTAVVFGFSLLGACAATNVEKGLCPSAAVLAPTASLTVFRANAPADPSGELYTLWMTNVTPACDFEKEEKTTKSHLDISFHATRAPSTEAANYRVPYYVAVTQGGSRILTKKFFLADVSFQPGETAVDFHQDVDDITVIPGKGLKIGSYMVLAGIQLTQAQLDYNKKTGRYAP